MTEIKKERKKATVRLIVLDFTFVFYYLENPNNERQTVSVSVSVSVSQSVIRPASQPATVIVLDHLLSITIHNCINLVERVSMNDQSVHKYFWWVNGLKSITVTVSDLIYQQQLHAAWQHEITVEKFTSGTTDALGNGYKSVKVQSYVPTESRCIEIDVCILSIMIVRSVY